MTAKELIEHLSSVAPNEDVLLTATCSVNGAVTHAYEIKSVRAMLEMDHEGQRNITYLVAGDELEVD